MMAVSCSESDLQQIPVPGGNETTVGISLSAAAMEAPAGRLSAVKAKASANEALTVDYGDNQTKAALTADDENKVYDLWVIQFDKATGNRVGQPYYASSEQIGQNGMNVSLEARLTTASTPQVVYFVANTQSPSTFHAGNCGTIAALEQVCREIGDAYRPTVASGLPMLAVKECDSIASGTPLSGATLRRLVAKVVLRYRLSASMEARGFTVTGVRLRNVPGTIRYAAEQTGAVDYPALAAGSHIDYPAEELATAGTEGDYKTLTWYMPENLRKAVVSVDADKDRVPANTDGAAAYIEIRGEMKSPEQCRRVVYSVVLGAAVENVNDYNVRRNNIYTATVDIEGLNGADKRVTVGSFDMSNSAMVVPNSGNKGAVTFDIRKLTKGWQTTMPALGSGAALRADVLWSDNASLASQINLDLDKVNGLLTVKSTSTTAGNVIVALYDNATSGGNILWSWHIWVTGYDPDGSKNYDLGPDSKVNVPGGQVHTYGAEYMATNPGKVIMDRNLGAAKAYYTAPAADDMDAQEAFGLFYQWGRKDPFPRAQGSSIDETSAAGIIIPIYGVAGNKLDPEGDKNVTTGSGCKKVSIATAGSNAPATLNYTIKNPLSSIYNEQGAPYDWYTTSASNQNNDLWGNGTTKSIYDPCPEGWRVPPIGTWSDFTREAADPMAGTFPYYINGVISETGSKFYAANGRLYKVSTSGTGTPLAWYPAAGYRERATGTLGGIGRFGYSWASSARDSDGAGLSFGPTGLSHAFATGLGARAYSYQVRCIQE